MLALELAWQTVGTADTSDTVTHGWPAELLTNPTWGVVQYAKITAVKAIYDIAELHRKAASGDMPPIAAWDAAERAARAAAQAMNPASNVAGTNALKAAYQSAALADTRRDQATLEAVTASALHAHAQATATTSARRMVQLTRQAIRSWRYLAGLDNPGDRPTSIQQGRQPGHSGFQDRVCSAAPTGRHKTNPKTMATNRTTRRSSR